MNRISIICLGVQDMQRSIQFYREGLGFLSDETEDNPAVIFLIPPAPNSSCVPWSF